MLVLSRFLKGNLLIFNKDFLLRVHSINILRIGSKNEALPIAHFATLAFGQLRVLVNTGIFSEELLSLVDALLTSPVATEFTVNLFLAFGKSLITVHALHP